MKKKRFIGIIVCCFVGLIIYTYVTLWCGKADVDHRVVLCIPVYGQSLALGEEAERVTDFDQLKAVGNGRIVTENIDYNYGYFDGSMMKQNMKKLLHYRKRQPELSVYGMAETAVSQLGADTLLCVFTGGQGTTALAHLSKGTPPYERFVADIKRACTYVREHGGQFVVPAICWMQGESDLEDYPGTDFKALLQQYCADINRDVKAITGQAEPLKIICYQPNSVSRAKGFRENNFVCPETEVPQSFVELLRVDTAFWASGPTYPYNFAREAIHIDGIGQKRLGTLAGYTVLSMLHQGQRQRGLIPLSTEAVDSTLVIHMNVPCPPLVIDTMLVAAMPHAGFKVVSQSNEDIAAEVLLDSCDVIIKCTQPVSGCKVRYAVNGTAGKSGRTNGPRGNLRDSQGESRLVVIDGTSYPLHNWCYQFDEEVTK